MALSQVAVAFGLLCVAAVAQQVEPAPGEALDVLPVWSGHPVGFTLWTEGEHQFVACYDAERAMTIAQRDLGSREWRVQRLPSRLGWDSHNSIALAVDPAGHVHVVGNLHASPLTAFHSEKPFDVTTLTRVAALVGDREQRMTYPVFLTGPNGRLVLRYRDGSSGSGDDLMDVYDHAEQHWHRLVDAPLLDGGGDVNGYFSTPARGPDGRYHIVGIWRDTPDCATNHDIAYARSADLVHWERADGKALALPMTPATIDVVDPVPARGGAINNNVKLGFDAALRPIVSYHKYDANGHTQVFCARFEGDTWRVRQIGDLGDYRWEFGGGGSIVFEVHIGAVRAAGDGKLALDVTTPKGERSWLLDADSLAVVGEAPPLPPLLPAKFAAVESQFAGMQKQTAGDAGHPPAGVRHVLVWETLPPNRDRARTGDLPGPSMLRVVALPRR